MHKTSKSIIIKIPITRKMGWRDKKTNPTNKIKNIISFQMASFLKNKWHVNKDKTDLFPNNRCRMVSFTYLTDKYEFLRKNVKNKWTIPISYIFFNLLYYWIKPNKFLDKLRIIQINLQIYIINIQKCRIYRNCKNKQ